mgnify:FL=1
MNRKEFVLNAVSRKQDLVVEVSDRIFDFAETGFHEFETAKLYQQVLEKEGFAVEMGIAGMPTAFKATYGNGKPVVGFLAEYDALPELSQVGGCTERKPVCGENPDGHGCGHNLLGAGTLAAALAVKAYLEENPGKGTVILFGCPSEEKGNGKTIMARDGIFEGVDAALTWHPDTANAVWTTSSLANVSVFFNFKGVTSHAAAAPELGRSALDAAELMSVGVNYLREHIISDARIHYAYRDVGGIAPNVVQGHSRVHYFIRAPKSWQVQEIYKRVIDVAEGAAKMTGTEMTYELYAGLSDFIPNHVLSEVLYEALEEVGDKIAPGDKAEVEADLNSLKEAINRAPVEEMTDAQVEDIKAGREKLMNSAQKLFAKVYEQAQQAGAGAGPNMGGANAGNAGSSKPDDDVVDADFKEV